MIIKCAECHQEISAEAKRCTHCGAYNRLRWRPWAVIAVTIVLVFAEASIGASGGVMLATMLGLPALAFFSITYRQNLAAPPGERRGRWQ